MNAGLQQLNIIKIAAVYKNQNQPDSAIDYAGKGLEESKLISQKKTILEAAALLSELYEQKDTKESLRYLKIADAYKDTLFGAGKYRSYSDISCTGRRTSKGNSGCQN